MKFLAVPEPLLAQVLAYLARRPYAEVFKLIGDLQSMTRPVEVKPSES